MPSFLILGLIGFYLFIVILILFSLWRQGKKLWWFYSAAVMNSIFFAFFLHHVPATLEKITAFRADWGLLYLANQVNMLHVLKAFVLFFAYFSLIAVIILLFFTLFAFVSWKKERIKVLLKKSVFLPWQIFLFALISVFLVLFSKDLGIPVNDLLLFRIIFLSTFLFLLQLFLRWMDNAKLQTSGIFLEFTYVSGLLMIMAFFIDQITTLRQFGDLMMSDIFIEHLVTFLLAFLLMGYLGTFFVRAYFTSSFFLQHFSWYIPLMIRMVKKYLPYKDSNLMTSEQHILKGIVLCVFLAFSVLLILAYKAYLLLVVFFFVAYFFLFYLLDRQEDMKIRGEVMEVR